MRKLIEKHQQKNGRGRGVILLSPKAYILSLLNFMPGMNTTSNISVQQANQRAKLLEEIRRDNPKTRAEGSYRNIERRRKSGKTKNQEDTERDIKLATLPTWRTEAADAAHYIGTGLSAVGGGLALLSNPITMGTALAGGMIGGRVVDKTSQKLTGKTWAENVQEKLGLQTPILAEFTNPGYFIGGGLGLKGKGALDYLIKADMPRFGYTPSTQYYFKPGYLGVNSSPIGKVPEGAKIVGELRGEPLIEINGKKYLLSKYNELHGGIPNLGYDPEVMSLEIIALENNPTISRIIDSDKKLTDAATLVKNKKSTVKVAAGNSKLREPSGRNLVTMLYLDNVEGPKTRGVGLVSTEPIENMTITSGNKYVSNGKYNRIAASATDSEQGAFKYGRINYPAIENYLKTDKVLSNSEKNAIEDIVKLLKELEKLADVSTEPGNTNGRVRFWKYDKNGKKIKVGDHYLRNEDLELKYKFLLKQLNDKLPGTFEYGGKNREIIYTAPNNRQILTTTTDNPNFGIRDVVVNGLEVRNYMGQPVSKFKTKIVDNNLDIAGSGKFNNMPDIEGTLGGYKVENKKFPGTFDIHDGYSQLLNVQRRLAEKPGWSSIFLGYDFNKPMRLYIRGTGPNPEAGMTTLSIPNGATPSLKQGNKIINKFKYVSKIKKRN